MTRWRYSPPEERTGSHVQRFNQNRYGKTPEPEFKTTTVRILAGIDKSIVGTRESLAAEIKEQKTSQAEIKKWCN